MAPRPDQLMELTSVDRSVRAGRDTVVVEAQALYALARCFDEPAFAGAFAGAIDLVASISGRAVCTGIGKSGLIARKLAATFASTGTPAFFLHPGEASHGDLGMVTRDDIVLAFSWSGETTELADVLDYCRRFSVKLVAITQGAESTLARYADICLFLPSVEEACPHQLTPTSSTTLQAALGDAIVVALIDRRGFSALDFGVFHPRGQLGEKLTTLSRVMSVGALVPKVNAAATIGEATIEMSLKRFGITAIVDDQDRLLGAFSDGDLRRSLAAAPLDSPVSAQMTTVPLALEPDRLASEALALMNSQSIGQLFICEDGVLVGIVHLHDLLRVRVA